MDRGKQCKFVKSDSSRCRAKAVSNSDYCFFHATEGNPKLAGAKGGRQGKRKTLAESNLSLKSIADVVSLLGTTINEIRRGDLDKTIGTSIGYLANILLRALQEGAIEERLTALERAVFEHSKPRRIK